MSPIEQLDAVPIEELKVGNAAFRRKIKRAGFATLADALRASGGEIDRRLGRDFETIDELDALKEEFSVDPETFLAMALEGRKSRRSTVSVPAESSRVGVKHAGHARDDRLPSVSNTRQVSAHSHRYGQPMPTDEVGKTLLSLESKAEESLDSLADRGTDYLAFEAFEDFATELDELSRCFGIFFKRYRGQIGKGYEVVAANVPNAFVIYCADLVRESFDGENLWGNLFGTLGLVTQNAQTGFKKLMIACLEKRGMPTYGADESDFYYFYTAILHGGLTSDLWEDLWEKSVLPMVKRASEDPYAFGGLLDGRSALALMLDGTYSPGATARNVMGKASESTLVPILDAAIRVAWRLSDPSTRLVVTMLNRSGLPDTALDALSKVRSNAQAQDHAGGARCGSHSSMEQRAGDLVYLPEGNLVLDLDEGQARIYWKASRLPDAFLGDRVDFFVNGTLLRSAEVVSDVRGCLIGGGSVALPPEPGYEVEIKLMHEARDGEWTEESSLEQTFARTKPGCLEFLMMPDGTYRLRKRGDRITRTRTVAYVIKPGREVVAGPGMRALEKRFTSDAWGDRMIWLFELDPGSSGAIVETATGRELASWQEDVTVAVNKSGCVGSTAEGLDLYGVRDGPRSDNESLPTITIEAADGKGVLDDLEIMLTCGEQRLFARRRLMQREGERSAAIVLDLSEVAYFPWFAIPCTLVIRRKSQGIAVFTYSFAVVPISAFALAGCDVATMEATYSLTVCKPLWVRGEDGCATLVSCDESYQVHVPLGDEWVSLAIDSEDNTSHADVLLRVAGVTVELDERTLATSKDHALSYADAYELGTARGRIAIAAHGVCEGRKALIMLGDKLVLLRDMSRPGIHYANIFSPPDLLLGMPEDSTELPLTLTVYCGKTSDAQDGWADLCLLKCREGLGFVRPQVLKAAHGHILYLGMPATCGLGVEVFRPATYLHDEKIVFSCKVPKGCERTDLPDWLVHQLDAHYRLMIRYYPLSLFGLPEYDFALTMPFER